VSTVRMTLPDVSPDARFQLINGSGFRTLWE
jgi:hypothetical protein